MRATSALRAARYASETAAIDCLAAQHQSDGARRYTIVIDRRPTLANLDSNTATTSIDGRWRVYRSHLNDEHNVRFSDILRVAPNCDN